MGITYHARYLDWFVIGRTELLRDVGLPYAELERAGLLLPVLEARCRYLRQRGMTIGSIWKHACWEWAVPG